LNIANPGLDSGMAYARDFKFGVHVDHSKYQPTGDKLSLKGAWSRHVTHFKFLFPPKTSQPTGDKLSLKGAWSRHVTHFKFLVPPKTSLKQLET